MRPFSSWGARHRAELFIDAFPLRMSRKSSIGIAAPNFGKQALFPDMLARKSLPGDAGAARK